MLSSGVARLDQSGRVLFEHSGALPGHGSVPSVQAIPVSSPALPVQRESSDSDSDSTSSYGPASGLPGTSSFSAAGLAQASQAPTKAAQDPFAGMHMQEIASRLYPYISSRIKAELRLERERNGVLTPYHR